MTDVDGARGHDSGEHTDERGGDGRDPVAPPRVRTGAGLPIPPDVAIGPVIVGVDEATTSGRPLRAAVFLSLALERPLLLVHVRRRSMPVIEGYLPAPEETAIGEQIQDELESELVATLKASPDLAGVHWELLTTSGDTGTELTRIAHDRDAACVVVGKRHRGFADVLHRIASGSVSRAMVSAHKWPVLVVP